MNNFKFVGVINSKLHYYPSIGVPETIQESNIMNMIISEFFDENPHLTFLKTEWIKGQVKLKALFDKSVFNLQTRSSSIPLITHSYDYDIFAEIYDLELQMQLELTIA